jgi:hypothetical protein
VVGAVLASGTTGFGFGSTGVIFRTEFHKKTAARALFLQKNIEQRVVNSNLAVVLDETQFSKAIHEKTYS